MSALVSILSLSDSVVITDTETTGINAHANRIIEIAGLRIDSEGTNTWFSELINPGVTIPHRITRITGITSAMVFGQPAADDVMPRFMEFLSDGIFVAHNIRFDTSFVNAEFERLGLPAMENRGLCTLRLARRLLPGLRSKSLGNLAKFYRIPPDGRHRAKKDVEITSIVLERLARTAIDDHGVTSIEELIELQGRTYARVNPHSKHVVAIRRDRLPELPAEPGVYYMKDGRGRVLYVGKAKDLSKRVSSYFTAIEAHPPRLRQLIAKVRDVSWRVMPTELHALIEESREIKRRDPSFNRAQKKYIPRRYLRLDQEEAFPRLTVQVIMREDGAEYYGPMRSRSQAQTLLDIIERHFPVRNCSPFEFERGKRCVRADIGRCPAPCEGQVERSDYDGILTDVRSFLNGDVETVSLQLQDDMMAAAESHKFEEAARLRDLVVFLEGRLQSGGVVADAVNGPEQIHFLRSKGLHSATLVLLAGGRLALLEAPDSSDDPGALIRDALRDLEEHSHPGSLNREDADARRVLDHWLYVNRADVVSLERREDEALEVFADRSEAVIALHLEATS